MARGQPHLTLPLVAPPLPDVDGLSSKGAGQVVMCPLAYDCYIEREVERDERNIRQVDLMNLLEDLLPQPMIRCFPFLLVEGIQGMVAVEVNVVSVGVKLVARQ